MPAASRSALVNRLKDHHDEAQVGSNHRPLACKAIAARHRPESMAQATGPLLDGARRKPTRARRTGAARLTVDDVPCTALTMPVTRNESAQARGAAMITAMFTPASAPPSSSCREASSGGICCHQMTA
jgi:hypothetical protein